MIIDLLQYSDEDTNVWKILLRKNHLFFIMNIQTHYIVKIQERQCKKMGIHEHIDNRLLMEYIRSRRVEEKFEKPHMLDLDDFCIFIENHLVEILERKNTIIENTDDFYFDVEVPLQNMKNDLDNLKNEHGFSCMDIFMEKYRKLEIDTKIQEEMECLAENKIEPLVEILEEHFVENMEEPFVEKMEENMENPFVESPVVWLDPPIPLVPTDASQYSPSNFEKVQKRIQELHQKIENYKYDCLKFNYDVNLLGEKMSFVKIMVNSLLEKKHT